MSSIIGGASASLGELKVFLTADTAKLASQLKNATTKMTKYRDTAAKVALASSAAFAGMTLGIKKLVDITSKQEAAERKLAVAIKATGAAINADRIKEYAAALQEVTTFGDEVTIESAALLATFGTTEQELLKLIPVAQDMAAMFGVALPQAAKTLGRTLAQGAGALTEYGIALTKAQIESFNLADKSGRVTKLVEIFAGVAGGAATQEALTLGGSLQQVNNAFGDVLEKIGDILRVSLVPALRGIKKAFEGIGDVLGRLNPEIASFLSFAAVIGTGLAAATAGVSALTAAVSGLSVVMLRLAPILIPILPLAAAIGAAFFGVVAAVGAVRRAWKADLGGVATLAGKFKDQIVKAFDTVRTIVLTAMDKITEKVVRAFTFWKEIFANAKRFWTGQLGQLKPLEQIVAEADAVIAKMRAAGGGGPGAVGAAGLEQFVAPTVNFIKEVGKVIKDEISTVGQMAQEGTKVLAGLGGDVVDAIIESITVETKVEATVPVAAAARREAAEPQPLPATLSEFIADTLKGWFENVDLAGQAMSEAWQELAGTTVGLIEREAPRFAGVLDGAVKGFAATGDATGAIIGALVNLALQLKPVAAALGIFESVIGGLMDGLNESLEPIADILSSIGRLLGSAALGIAKATKILVTITGLGILGNFFNKIMPSEIQDMSTSLQEANRILEGTVQDLSRIFGRETQAFVTEAPIENLSSMLRLGGPELQDAVRKELEARLDAATLSQQVAEVQAALMREEFKAAEDRFKAAQASGEFSDRSLAFMALGAGLVGAALQGFEDTAVELAGTTDELRSALGALDEQTVALDENMAAVNEELTNVPTGFKIALSRFRAIEGEAVTAPSLGLGGGPQTFDGLSKPIPADRGGGMMNIETMYIGGISAENAQTFLESLKGEAEWVDTVSNGPRPSRPSVLASLAGGAPFTP